MSIIPSKSFKTMLYLAVAAADECTVDGEDTTCRGWGDNHFFRHRDSEEQFRYDDQEIEVRNGEAFFRTRKGEQHEIVFHITRRLTLNDIILNRLMS